MKILHHTSIFMSYIIIIFLPTVMSSSSSQVFISSDRTALLTIKSMISDPSSALSSWADNTTLHFCRWRGVTCSSRHPDRVTSLILDSLNLTGSLPPQIANLTFLHRLHLPGNNFQGSIPHELGLRLSRLTHLNLKHNYLDGEIPATLTHCSNLQFIGLQINQLSGEIPRDIGSLSQLKSLSLSTNNLTGTIPPSLSNLSSSSFVYLDLSLNHLVGGIPQSLGKLSSLGLIDLSFNNLSGNIPFSVYNLSSLTDLWLEKNSLTGALPSNMFDTLPILQYLVLYQNQLQGHIPSSVSNATSLRDLHVGENNFSGSIPHELGLRLSRLTRLNLSHNYLDGEIPATLTRCSNLQFISLGNNQLSGEIPSDIGSLSQLKVLSLYINNLIGTIPPSLGNLSSSFFYLGLHANHLVGGIPESLGKLSSLDFFDLCFNNLSGNIPFSIYNLSSLTEVWLQYNSLTGALKSNMFDTLPVLQYLELSHNQIEGHIPSSVSNATSLQYLEMGDNNLIGTIPSNLGNLPHLYWLLLNKNQLEAKEASDWDFLASLANCSNLQKLLLQENHLGGILPSSVANLSTTLQSFTIFNNQISGSIPDGIGNLANLLYLDLSSNLLSGCIPPTLGKLQQLNTLYLNGNQFMGQIPHTIRNLTQLNTLSLQSNSLNGSIPASLGECQSLLLLDLSLNMLTGAIPKEIVMLPSLSQFLDLSHNLLTGILPSEVGKLKHLTGFNISHNKLSGQIPASLGDCQSLELLYMEVNFFSGAIPQSFSELKGLVELDLAQNNLSGKFPVYFGRLGALQYLNVSYNDLDGIVPDEGILRNNASQISVLGNKKLCGGNPSLHLSACITPMKKQHHISLLLKVIIPIVSTCLCMILFIVIFFARHRLKNKQKKSPVTPSIKGQFTNVSYADLLKATDGFSPSNLIGVGSVGTVYRGFLNFGENTSVAVKVLNLQRQGASKSFLAECEVLRSIRHRNLVKILTLCSSVDFNGNDFKALVLEFMPNGSLEKWLHPIVSSHDNSELMPLSLDERLSIAIDIASAVEYLHHHGQAPIVHCDLKPSNILLDSDMCGHVGDFGLAKFIWEKLPGVDEQQTTSSGIKGTIGYVAPEYGMGSQASTYGDVYSYGVLMLELFTGKQPTDKIFTDVQSLRNYVELVFPEKVMDIVDPRLYQETQDNNKIGVKEYSCLVSVIGIGLSCSKTDPRERMKMKDITRELHALKAVLHKSETHV